LHPLELETENEKEPSQEWPLRTMLIAASHRIVRELDECAAEGAEASPLREIADAERLPSLPIEPTRPLDADEGPFAVWW
jgi:hypothetical protein